MKILFKRAGIAAAGEAAEHFRSAGRRAGTRVEERDVDFAGGKRAVKHGQIADDDGEEAEAEAGFADGNDARDFGARSDVAESESEECGAAHVQIGAKAGMACGTNLRNDG